MKTYISTIKIVALGVVLSLFGISCSDFLDTEQRGVTSQDNFYKTEAEAEQAVYAIYDRLQLLSVSTFRFNNTLSDDTQGGGGGTGDPVGLELDRFNISSSNSMVEEMFSKYYRIVYAANVLLKNVSEDSDTKMIYRAEAKMLRAYAYFELTTMWGTPPLVLEPLSGGEYNQPNSTTEELWAQIEQDLTEAISVLPLKSQQNKNRLERVSKGTAQSLLGKAYLFQKKYDKAAEILDHIINSGEYDLYGDFSKLTRSESEFGIESIFEISYIADVSQPLESTQIAQWCGGGGTGYFSAGNSGLLEATWGYAQPEKGLREAFLAEGDIIRQRSSVLNEQDLGDLYGATIRAADGSMQAGTDGLMRMKYAPWLDEIAASNPAYAQVSGTNYRLIRFADVLLMAAEANNRMAAANDVKACNYVNRVRARVNLDPISAGGDELFEKIKNERRLELAFEFVRYQDLVRWGDAETVLAHSGRYFSLGSYIDGVEQFITVNNAGYKPATKGLMPFPETEISVNPKIKQNEGY